jgi:hypothetical protein
VTVNTEHRLHHCQRDEFGVGELRGDPDGRTPWRQMRRRFQQVVGLHIECRRKGVQVVRHKTILDALVFVSVGTP